MKKLLAGFLIGINVFGFGCSGIASQEQGTVTQQSKEDKKREEFLGKVEAYMQNLIDNYNEKNVENKITLAREDNVITYITPLLAILH